MNLKILEEIPLHGSISRLSFKDYNINKYDVLLIANQKNSLITFDYKDQQKHFLAISIFYIFACNYKN